MCVRGGAGSQFAHSHFSHHNPYFSTVISTVRVDKSIRMNGKPGISKNALLSWIVWCPACLTRETSAYMFRFLGGRLSLEPSSSVWSSLSACDSVLSKLASGESWGIRKDFWVFPLPCLLKTVNIYSKLTKKRMVTAKLQRYFTIPWFHRRPRCSQANVCSLIWLRSNPQVQSVGQWSYTCLPTMQKLRVSQYIKANGWQQAGSYNCSQLHPIGMSCSQL